MNNLTTFNNPEFGQVRTTEIDGEPWFVARDVATALGYANPNDAISKHVDNEDKTDGVAFRDTMGRTQTPVLINESGLYSLVMSSKLDGARRFKRWVTGEVLPSIRRHGMYATGVTVERMIADPDFAINLLNGLKAERQRRLDAEAKTAELEEQVRHDAPKVLFADAVSASQRSCLVAELAKILQQNGVDIGQNRLFKWLRENGYLGNRGEYYNQPNQRFVEMGLFEIKYTTVVRSDGTSLRTSTPKVTGKGQIYFVNKFLH